MRKLIRTCCAVFMSAAVCGVAFAASAAPAAARQHVDLDSFLTGLACTESGGRFQAVNASTGAFGKYQVMPRNWVSWSARYLNNRWAAPTKRNQEFVVRMRVSELRSLPRTWREIAHWWLTGNATSDEALWSMHSTGYVNRVVGTARDAAKPDARSLVSAPCFPANVPDAHVRAKPWPRVTITGGRVNVRAGAGAENRMLTTVKRGTKLAVLGRAADARGKDWLHVGLSDGTTGWVAAWYTASVN